MKENVEVIPKILTSLCSFCFVCCCCYYFVVTIVVTIFRSNPVSWQFYLISIPLDFSFFIFPVFTFDNQKQRFFSRSTGYLKALFSFSPPVAFMNFSSFFINSPLSVPPLPLSLQASPHCDSAVHSDLCSGLRHTVGRDPPGHGLQH